MIKKSLTFVELIIVVAMITLLFAIAVPKFIIERAIANIAVAKSNVHRMSIAAEKFAIEHGGMYPDSVAELKTSINSRDACCDKVVGGYKYTCGLAENGYTIVAAPVTPGVSGGPTFTAATRGVLTQS